MLEASKQVYNSLLQPLFDHAGDAWGEISEGCVTLSEDDYRRDYGDELPV